MSHKASIVGLFAGAILIGVAIMLMDRTQDEIIPDSKPKVKIGLIYPLSGDNAKFGEAARVAVSMFLADNEEKLNKFNYEFIYEDNQMKPQQSVTALNKLINIDKADIVITTISNVGRAVSSANNGRIIHFSSSTDKGVADGDFNFNISSSAENEVSKLINVFMKKGYKKIDIVYANTSGPALVAKLLEEKLNNEKTMKTGNVFSINQGEKDFRIMIYKICNSNPDILFLQLQAPEVDIFMKQFREINKDIPVTGISTFSFLENKAFAEGQWYVDFAQANKGYIKKFESMTGDNVTVYSEYVYAILQILVDTYENSEGYKPSLKDISDYLLKNINDYETVVGKVNIDKEGAIDAPSSVLMIEDGNIVIVE